MQKMRQWLWAVVCLGLFGGYAAGLSAASLPFATETAVYQDSAQQLVLDGRIEAVHRSTVSAQGSGRIMEIAYDVDDYVTAGSLIVRLTDTEQRARVNQANAAFNEAQAGLREAEAEFKRISDIFARNLVSRADMDRATSARDAARARLDAARASRDEANEQLEYTRVRAPFAGIVLERYVEIGETVNPGQPLMAGISLDALRITADVPQRHINAVREHRQATVHMEDRLSVPTQTLTFFPYADPQTNTFRVRADLPTGISGLFPGMSVKVAFTVGQKQRLVVPRAAVMHRSELTAVYVVGADNRVHLRQIRSGHADEVFTEVLAGLQAGERVALEPIRAGLYLKQQAQR